MQKIGTLYRLAADVTDFVLFCDCVNRKRS